MTKPENPRAVAGDNSVEDGQLLALVERIERLEEDAKTVADEKKDVFAEAKGAGYDVKIMRKVIARRKADRDKLSEEEELIATYERAITRRGG